MKPSRTRVHDHYRRSRDAPISGQDPIYEIALADQTPNVDFLRQRRDLEEFRIVYRNFLSTLMKDHPDVKELHLFPAVPAPVAIACGHDLLPKVHPVLLVYDYDKKTGGFILGLQVNVRSQE